MATTTIAVRVKRELLDALSATAALNGRTIAQEHRVALREWIRANTLQIDAAREDDPGRVQVRREVAERVGAQ